MKLFEKLKNTLKSKKAIGLDVAMLVLLIFVGLCATITTVMYLRYASSSRSNNELNKINDSDLTSSTDGVTSEETCFQRGEDFIRYLNCHTVPEFSVEVADFIAGFSDSNSDEFYLGLANAASKVNSSSVSQNAFEIEVPADELVGEHTIQFFALTSNGAREMWTITDKTDETGYAFRNSVSVKDSSGNVATASQKNIIKFDLTQDLTKLDIPVWGEAGSKFKAYKVAFFKTEDDRNRFVSNYNENTEYGTDAKIFGADDILWSAPTSCTVTNGYFTSYGTEPSWFEMDFQTTVSASEYKYGAIIVQAFGGTVNFAIYNHPDHSVCLTYDAAGTNAKADATVAPTTNTTTATKTFDNGSAYDLDVDFLGRGLGSEINMMNYAANSCTLNLYGWYAFNSENTGMDSIQFGYYTDADSTLKCNDSYRYAEANPTSRATKMEELGIKDTYDKLTGFNMSIPIDGKASVYYICAVLQNEVHVIWEINTLPEKTDDTDKGQMYIKGLRVDGSDLAIGDKYDYIEGEEATIDASSLNSKKEKVINMSLCYSGTQPVTAVGYSVDGGNVIYSTDLNQVTGTDADTVKGYTNGTSTGATYCYDGTLACGNLLSGSHSYKFYAYINGQPRLLGAITLKVSESPDYWNMCIDGFMCGFKAQNNAANLSTSYYSVIETFNDTEDYTSLTSDTTWSKKSAMINTDVTIYNTEQVGKDFAVKGWFVCTNGTDVSGVGYSVDGGAITYYSEEDVSVVGKSNAEYKSDWDVIVEANKTDCPNAYGMRFNYLPLGTLMNGYHTYKIYARLDGNDVLLGTYNVSVAVGARTDSNDKSGDANNINAVKGVTCVEFLYSGETPIEALGSGDAYVDYKTAKGYDANFEFNDDTYSYLENNFNLSGWYADNTEATKFGYSIDSGAIEYSTTFTTLKTSSAKTILNTTASTYTDSEKKIISVAQKTVAQRFSLCMGKMLTGRHVYQIYAKIGTEDVLIAVFNVTFGEKSNISYGESDVHSFLGDDLSIENIATLSNGNQLTVNSGVTDKYLTFTCEYKTKGTVSGYGYCLDGQSVSIQSTSTSFAINVPILENGDGYVSTDKNTWHTLYIFAIDNGKQVKIGEHTYFIHKENSVKPASSDIKTFISGTEISEIKNQQPGSYITVQGFTAGTQVAFSYCWNQDKVGSIQLEEEGPLYYLTTTGSEFYIPYDGNCSKIKIYQRYADTDFCMKELTVTGTSATVDLTDGIYKNSICLNDKVVLDDSTSKRCNICKNLCDFSGTGNTITAKGIYISSTDEEVYGFGYRIDYGDFYYAKTKFYTLDDGSTIQTLTIADDGTIYDESNPAGKSVGLDIWYDLKKLKVIRWTDAEVRTEPGK